MKRLLINLWLALFVFSSVTTSSLSAASYYKTLQAGDRVYHEVRVRKVTSRALTVLHRGGLSQIMLRDLSPEIQAEFGYSPEKEAAYLAEQRKKEAWAKQQRKAKPKVQPSAQKAQAENTSPAERALQRFGQPPSIRDEVDLRPEYISLNLVTKNQGRRPSCSIFAVVSALEFQNAKLIGQPEKLSEEYLIWATRKTLGLSTVEAASFDPEVDADAGFALLEVVQALRRYGIPTQKQMPNTYGKSMAKIAEPSAELIQAALDRRKVHSYIVTGRDNELRIGGILHALNEGIPVVVGMAWPNSESLSQSPILSRQKPVKGYAHAVALIGYRADGGNTDNLRFVFKNSWGHRWGVNGHGWVTYEYLKKHMNSAVILDVSP